MFLRAVFHQNKSIANVIYASMLFSLRVHVIMIGRDAYIFFHFFLFPFFLSLSLLLALLHVIFCRVRLREGLTG